MKRLEYEYRVQGYSDGYWKRLSESGLSENKLALIRTNGFGMSAKQKCLAVASSFSEMKMKCAILGFEMGEVTHDDGTWMTYNVREAIAGE